MAQTAAERQAARRARVQSSIDELAATNATLVAEVSRLTAENLKLRDKVHALELAAARAQAKAAKEAKGA